MAPAAMLDVQGAARWWSKDTVAVVTGSNKGIGYEIVLALAREGVTVASTARDAERGLAAVDSALKAEPELAELIHFHQLDITDEQSVTQLAAWLLSKFGGIDILVRASPHGCCKSLGSDLLRPLESKPLSVIETPLSQGERPPGQAPLTRWLNHW